MSSMAGSPTIMQSLAGSKVSQNSEQHFEYLLVLDFEATCQGGRKISPQEIIEFPCALLNVKNGFQIEDIFHKYVRPIHHPILTEFCTNLTGITNDMVSTSDTFEPVFTQFRKWVENEHDLVGLETESTKDRFAFVTCGDWDLRHMLPEQSRISQVSVPGYMKRWINVKSSFSSSFGTKQFPKGLSSMLTQIGLEFEGRPHSGIDDVKNIVRIVQHLAQKRNFVFETTGFL